MRFVAVAALLATALAVASTAAAGGSAKPVGGARALAVSVPADPVPARAGDVARTMIRVVNPNDFAVSVLIRSRTLALGDDGKVSIGSGPDPRWGGRVRFPHAALRIPAQSYRNVALSIRVPRLSPDLYFVGFLVTPVATSGGSVKVINQIGSFLTLDVPGPRLRLLTGHLHLPSFVLGSQASGEMRITNLGHAAVTLWGENDITSSPGGAFQQDRLGPSLLPVGRSRSIAVTGKPRWPVGIVTVTTRVTYPGRTASETRELVLTRRVLVISPWVPAALGGLIALLAAVWCRRRRRPSGNQPAGTLDPRAGQTA
ncbi:MAG TPA: hypothetical protein VFU51_02270 [Gaiellaceae bacterium]|nr:hypothetical protein [Gaiellaceae bacterium]